MKKLIFSGLIILFGSGAYAQNASANKPRRDARTPEQRAEHFTNRMDKQLTLTSGQKAKIYEINLKYAKINQEARAKDSANRSAVHQELKTNEAEREAEFKTILTADQLKTFQTAKQEQREKRIERRRKK